MKTTLLLLSLSLFVVLAFAEPMIPGNVYKAVETPQGYRVPQTRNVPEYVFSRLPTSLITSYYDYMIGSYNGLPIRTIPQSEGGGYFLTYTGRRQATSTRRTFYANLDAQGNVINNNEITSMQNHEGFSTLAVDPVSGKPMYAWHANADADAPFEVQFTSDAFISGIAGLFNDIQIIINNPVSITAPGGTTTTNNEFIWPTAVIGPSPIANKRRVYVAARNFTSNTSAPCENLYIAYADFNGNDIEDGVALTWSHTSIPEMNNWNVDLVNWRRPFHAIAVDNAGNLFYAGYHSAQSAGGANLNEADMDVFKCTNYGQGTWSRVSSFSNLPSWNPPASPGGTTGFFTNANGIPYADNQLSWKIVNSSHLNAVVDNIGRVHVPAIWGLTTSDGTYYPAMQFVKEFVYDPALQQYEVREIWPKNDIANQHSQYYQPWDVEAPWGVVDEYLQSGGNYSPAMVNDWPFPHWDASAHTDAMMFHYNNIKMSEPNAQGMMVCVWQNSQRARMFNHFADTNFSAFSNTPEIYISVSPNNGVTWFDPIVLNNVETPQLAGIKPMWVYPADKVIYTGMQGNNPVGKIGIMFYNDFTWGANSISPPYHPTATGGQVMFMELQIVFAQGVPNQIVAMPSFNPPAGTYQTAQNVSIACITPGAQIRYTTNGSEPTETSALYTNPIFVGSTTTIKAKGYHVDLMPSNIATAVYTITGTVATPVFSHPGGTYNFPLNVVLTCATPGAVIRFTTNGTEPTTTSTAYMNPIAVATTTTIKAKGFLAGWIPSTTATVLYTITGTVAMPVFNPPAGTYTSPQNVVLTCATPGALIHLTYDGTEPTETSTIYNSPIIVASTVIIKAKGFAAGWIPSTTATALYTITGTVAMPLFSPPGGTYNAPQNVTITSGTAGAQIRYTTDGSDPTDTSNLYSEPVYVNVTTTIKARAYLSDWAPSYIAMAVYQIVSSNPDDEQTPAFTGIQSVYPNPFSASITIALGVKESNQGYRLRIYNLRGECVYQERGVKSGLFDIAWNGTDMKDKRLPSGVYLLIFESGKHRHTRKVVML
ncbi:MAG: chitobiase/beta-hexosaminidase C-terminal domain-containing protein [Candidatus Cloacimonadaceae bacterium]|nr:chitobiase/beta-hexosaminidase C-terminal domain-containing protein [Candidatus Cloacimonadaceae bacterium]